MNQKTDENEEKHSNFGIIRVLIYQLLATVVLATEDVVMLVSSPWFGAGRSSTSFGPWGGGANSDTGCLG